ncbi:MAG: hypothetical protein R3F08_04005 [Dokdonella sp.]
MGDSLIKSLREVSPNTALRVGISHAFLLVAALVGSLPFVFVQALLAVELILVSLATIPFYPERGLQKHLLDMLKLGAASAFVLFFSVVSYGVAAEGDSGNALEFGMSAFARLDWTDIAWALAYLVLHVAISLRTAMTSADPRATWAQNKLAEGGATFLALFFMVFVALFVGRPIVVGLAVLGSHVDVDALLSGLMVLVRYVLMLIVSLIPESEMKSIARNPYSKR